MDILKPLDSKSATIFNEHEEFKSNIKLGFEARKKNIPAKYLYDNRGSELFNEITRHPDYYLTRVELDILETYKNEIAHSIGKETFNLIDLGPGEGTKTEILIQEFLCNSLIFTYVPIDISQLYLKRLLGGFNSKFKKLISQGIHADYFSGLDWVCKTSAQRNLVLFLGSSIGNFEPETTKIFLRHLHQTLQHGDYILLGFDLCKDISILMRAYDDSAGITRAFNFNLLERINRELDANFDVNKFCHYPTYNVHTSAMESYLISLEKQKIDLGELNKSYILQAIEPIHIEFSYKYNATQIEQLAINCGFKIVNNFFDNRHYFVDTLWMVDKHC